MSRKGKLVLASFIHFGRGSWPRVSPRVGAPRCVAPKAAGGTKCSITSTFTVPPCDPSPPMPTSDHQREPTSRHSPLISLPPLDYLQQHRRGSLTDPSLHAAFRHADGARPSPSPPSYRSHNLGPRPAANYVFGDTGASSIHPEPSIKQMRKILRSPSLDRDLDHPANGRLPQSTPRSNGLSSASFLSFPPTARTSFSRKHLPRPDQCRQRQTLPAHPYPPPRRQRRQLSSTLHRSESPHSLSLLVPRPFRPRTPPTPNYHTAQNAKCRPTAKSSPPTISIPTSLALACRAR